MNPLELTVKQFSEAYTTISAWVQATPDVEMRPAVIALLTKENPTANPLMQDYAQELLFAAIAEKLRYNFTPVSELRVDALPYETIGTWGPWYVIEHEWRMNALAHMFLPIEDPTTNTQHSVRAVKDLWVATSGFEPSSDQIISLADWLEQL